MMEKEKSPTRQKIDELEKLIEFSKSKIAKLQKECKHRKLKHSITIGYRMTHGCMECMDCRADLQRWSKLTEPNDVEKEWVEEREV